MIFLLTNTVTAGAERVYGGNFYHNSGFSELWLIVIIFLADQASSKPAQNPVGWRDLQAGTDMEKKVASHSYKGWWLPLMLLCSDKISSFQK